MKVSNAFSITMLALWGVLLPSITLVMELSTGMCAEDFFNPIPTLLHVLLIAITPLASLYLMYIFRADKINEQAAAIGAVIGLAGVIGLYYTLIFLPILPLAVIGIIMLIGFLPLSPILLTGTLLLGALPTAGCQLVAGRRARFYVALAVGILIGCAGITVADYQATATARLVAKAGSDDAAVRADAVKQLRDTGHDVGLRVLCMGVSVIVGPVSVFDHGKYDEEAASTVFYRVMGRRWNTATDGQGIRSGFGLFGRWEPPEDAFGTLEVSDFVGGLSLSEASIVGETDVASGTVYTETTLEFANARANVDEEARFRLRLPAGGVVSRLVLWVNGEAREAAYDRQHWVQAAYQQFAVRPPPIFQPGSVARDPVLVTTTGPDEVFVQVFPVPRAGKVRLRIGVTAPLIVEGEDMPETGRVALPRITERNFMDMNPASVTIDTKRDGEHTLDTLRELSMPLRGMKERVLAADPFVEEQNIEQRLERTAISAPVTVVVDASGRMKDAAAQVCETIEGLRGHKVRFLVAGDAVRSAADAEQCLAVLENEGFVGGRDNMPALLQAWNTTDRGHIVWLHGPQAVELDPIALPPRENAPLAITAVRLAEGRNHIVEKLERETVVIAAQGNPSRVIAQLAGEVPAWRYVREAVKRGDEAAEGSSHIVRLWAADAARWSMGGGEDKVEDAVAKGKLYRLVTPVTGAVVLETQAMYDQAGLKPVDPTTVPTVPAVPEPGTWVLMMVAAIVAIFAMWRRRSGMLAS